MGNINKPPFDDALTPWDLWYKDLEPQQLGNIYKIQRVLYSGESEYQRIDVFEHGWLGRMLVLYGAVMMTERDEFIYHEMITHPALFVHPDPRRVLVIGGGDGCTLREVLRHPSVTLARQGEIDGQVVEVAREWLSEVNGNSFDDPRVDLVIDDANTFLDGDDGTYDVVLSDCSDPLGPAEVLFEKDFFEKVLDRLGDHGIFAAQTESPMFYPDQVREIHRRLHQVFPVVRMYLAHIPTYPGAMYSFAFCSRGLDPVGDFHHERVSDLGLETKYYNADLHGSCFVLPTCARELTCERPTD